MLKCHGLHQFLIPTRHIVAIAVRVETLQVRDDRGVSVANSLPVLRRCEVLRDWLACLSNSASMVRYLLMSMGQEALEPLQGEYAEQCQLKANVKVHMSRSHLFARSCDISRRLDHTFSPIMVGVKLISYALKHGHERRLRLVLSAIEGRVGTSFASASIHSMRQRTNRLFTLRMDRGGMEESTNMTCI